MEFVSVIYNLTSSFPSTEQFGITSQMRRSSISVPSNIAEGFGRQTTKELIQFLYISRGSLSELETQILISKNLKFITETERLEQTITIISKMLSNLITKLKDKK